MSEEKYFSRDNLELVIDGLKTEMVPNWNENDSGALGYINNRTHYEEITELFSIENAEFIDGEYINETPFVITDGNTYIVNWDGTEYTCVAYVFNGLFAIGDTSFLDGKGNGEPFAIGYNNEANVNFITALNDSTDGSTVTHTFSVVGNLVHTINPKYLPKLVGKNVTGVKYTIDDETMTAGAGAEIFNAYYDNIASGNFSHAEGCETTATGESSHAEGGRTTASGGYSHAEGFNTAASGYDSHAEGVDTESFGYASHAEGGSTIASGEFSHAEGHQTSVTDSSSVTATTTTDNSKGYAGHAEGYGTVSYGRCSHAEGNGTTASGSDSHAEGNNTTASGSYSHAEGYDTTASGGYGSHAEGRETTASGTASHAEGYKTTASKAYSHAEGWNTTASGSYAHAEGLGTTASGIASHAEGDDTTASGDYSHAEGSNTIVGENRGIKFTDSSLSGYAGHAEGYGTVSYGRCSHAEGNGTKASGYDSHAEGYKTEASGNYSHAEGSGTTASGGFGSHAEGCITTASGSHGSHAEGYYTTASGRYSHAEGHYTTASCDAQHVQGKWNIEDTSSTYAHIVGNGIADTLSNAHTLDWDGNAWFAGDVYVGSTSGTNKDEGSVKLIRSPATATVGQTIRVSAVDENGVPTAWEAADMPNSTGEKEWSLLSEVDFSITPSEPVKLTELDNFTDFLLRWENIKNATETASGLNIQINGISICGNNAVPSSIASATQNNYGYTTVKYNGLIWEIVRSAGAISNENLAISSQSYIPYNPVFDVGKATSLTLSCATQYLPTSGVLKIYGR